MDEADTCRFHIQLTAKELWRFTMYHTNKGIMGIFNVLFTVGALFLLCLNWNTATVSYKLVLFLCILMFTVWQPGLLYRKSKIQAKSPMIAVPMDLTFSEQGIQVAQGEKSTELTWDRIARADRGPGMVILYMDKIHAYLIPASAMNGQEQALLTLLREHLPRERRKRI